MSARSVRSSGRACQGITPATGAGAPACVWRRIIAVGNTRPRW
ncbi:MAG: DUF3649 domain-containing protein [Actinomycetales bacterium]